MSWRSSWQQVITDVGQILRRVGVAMRVHIHGWRDKLCPLYKASSFYLDRGRKRWFLYEPDNKCTQCEDGKHPIEQHRCWREQYRGYLSSKKERRMSATGEQLHLSAQGYQIYPLAMKRLCQCILYCTCLIS